MKSLHFVTSFALFCSLAAPGCVIVQDDDDGSNTSSNDDGATSNGGDDNGGGDNGGGDNGGGDNGGGDGGTCEMDDPGGESCDAGSDCSIVCQCSDGDVTVGSCINNVCESAADACGSVCDSFDGFCRVDSGGGDDGNADDGSGGDGGGVCSDPGEACDVNGDCCGFDSGMSGCIDLGDAALCADLCDFDSDCASDCCIPLDGGAGACAPSELC